MFIEGVRDIHANIQNFSCPVLYLHGTGDTIVEYESTEWLYANNPTKDKSKILYDGMYHEILNEVEKEKVMNDILNWLNER
jgi:alpha-beta hydrolase superfamily lysophospholipase